MDPYTIAVDFDGTLVMHEYPRIGNEVPMAFSTLRSLQKMGVRLILWTMRSDGKLAENNYLQQAIRFCRDQDVLFYAINRNPSQDSWTNSPKVLADMYVDDSAFGIPTIEPRDDTGTSTDRPFVDWSRVGPSLLIQAAMRLDTFVSRPATIQSISDKPNS